MKYIYLVHEVCESYDGHDEENVLRAFTNYEAACACINELNSKDTTDLCLENYSYYISRINLEEDL